MRTHFRPFGLLFCLCAAPWSACSHTQADTKTTAAKSDPDKSSAKSPEKPSDKAPERSSAKSSDKSSDKKPTPQQPPANSTGIEARQIAAEEQTSYVVEFKFPSGGASLSKEQEDKLTTLYQKAHGKGKIAHVKVITWADEEYPSVNARTLPDDQRKLADQRNQEITRCFKRLDAQLSVDVYSMAERPGAIASLTDNESARIKKLLEQAGIPNTDTNIKFPAMAGKTIAMVILKQ